MSESFLGIQSSDEMLGRFAKVKQEIHLHVQFAQLRAYFVIVHLVVERSHAHVASASESEFELLESPLL